MAKTNSKSSKSSESSPKKQAPIQLKSLAVQERPTTLADLVGQDHIATEILGMLKRRRFPPTMLFNGWSGCGKTTTARMVARYLMCKNPEPKTYAPCGECISCRFGDSHPDVSEINMAEQRGIDDVRGLIQCSQNMPTIGDYRVFLIDEIHAMTPQAAQAFLKPLEEPPPRTLWLLATTNPEKLPTTVLGRCHRFDVKPIEPQVLVNRLYKLAKREGVDFKTVKDGVDMLKLMANLADGRLRDAIALLEKVLFVIASGEEIDSKTILSKFLTSSDADLEKASASLVCAILGNKLPEMLKAVRSSVNVRQLLSKTRWLIQFLIDDSVKLAKYTPYNARLFAKMSKDQGVKVNIAQLVRLQYLLLEIEVRFNSMSVEENVVMLSMVGNFMALEGKKS